jgi:GNAT superfamily N-acetyltransferase
MEVCEARPEDAQEACPVLRRSIIELCAADHGHDPELLAAWLANKTPENFAAWMERANLRQRPGRVYGVAGMESRSLPAERVVDAIVLRPLTVSDAEIASEVIRSAFTDQPRPTRPPSSALRETASSIASKIEAGGGFGAWAGARLVALALWQVAGDTLHVARVSVLPERRGERLSRRLLGRCEDAARARGLSRVTLRVRLELPENERLFERFGFRRVRVEAHEGFHRPTTSVMEKELS